MTENQPNLASGDPTITPEQIDAEIAAGAIFYFRADQGALAAVSPLGSISQSMLDKLHLVTLCVVVLANGFKVIGTSAKVSPGGFDPQIGRNLALQDAREQIRVFLGFRLADQLNAQTAEAKAVDSEVGTSDTVSAR